MSINENLINSFIRATERAAYGASLFKGKNDSDNVFESEGRCIGVLCFNSNKLYFCF